MVILGSDKLRNLLPKRQVVLIVLLAGIAFALALSLPFILKKPTQSGSLPLSASTIAHDKPEEMQPGLPVRLRIPRLNVDAALDYVGLTPQGDMDIPKSPANVGWYQQGPRPGKKGSAVIDGHFGWENGIPAVFDNLHTLQKGDKVQVEDEKGAIIAFVVTGSRAYAPNEDATDVFRSSDGKTHLNLITCQGAWSRTQQSYSNRLVVFADKEGE